MEDFQWLLVLLNITYRVMMDLSWGLFICLLSCGSIQECKEHKGFLTVNTAFTQTGDMILIERVKTVLLFQLIDMANHMFVFSYSIQTFRLYTKWFVW
jgi:hypothetical protein